MNTYIPDPKLQGDTAALDRLDDAINHAISCNQTLAFEYRKHTLQSDLAGILHSLRINAGLTQAQCAKMANLPQSFVSRLENPDADKQPTLESLSKIANVLGKKLIIELVDVNPTVKCLPSTLDNNEHQDLPIENHYSINNELSR
jgi:transcriptional regulator with XRE-family HTH domain